MRRFGLSAAVLVALAAPAWAQYPAQGLPDVMPGPAGYAPPGYYPDLDLAGYAPPVSLPPGGPVGCPPGAPGCAPAGYGFDPCCPNPCSPAPRVCNEYWARADWLYWSFRDAPVPPLIVTGNPNIPGAGIPTGGNSLALVGPRRDLGQFSGIRATVGQWFDPDGELGAEVSGFVFERRGTADFFRGSATRPLSVPVLSSAGELGVYDYSFPGQFAGSLGVRTANQLLGGEGSLVHRFANRQFNRNSLTVDGLFGFRYLWMNERLELLGQMVSDGAIPVFGGANLPAGSTVFTTDVFRARTEFYGGQIGLRGEVRRDIFILAGYGKGGVGANVQTLRAEGSTMAVGPGGTQTLVGGVRVLPGNFGRDTNTDFSLVGETGIEVGVQVSKRLSVRAGYNLLWWSDVLRPANVISPVLTRSQVPIDETFSAAAVANPRPVTVFRSSDFLAHGLVVGAMLEW
jgi:hypothetical protein